MKQYRAVDGGRLDTIVYKVYGSIAIDVMSRVIDANSHLLSNARLSAGDIVNLPEIMITQEESQAKALWS